MTPHNCLVDAIFIKNAVYVASDDVMMIYLFSCIVLLQNDKIITDKTILVLFNLFLFSNEKNDANMNFE